MIYKCNTQSGTQHMTKGISKNIYGVMKMKKVLLIVLSLSVMLAMLVLLTACGSSIQDDWASIIVGENVPTPQKGKLNSGSNLDDYF